MIRIDLEQIPQNTKELYFVVNVYSSFASFGDVSEAYVRLCVAKEDGQFNPGHELARYNLDSSITTKGLIFSKLIRVGQIWSLVAIGVGCDGKTGVEDKTINAVKSQAL